MGITTIQHFILVQILEDHDLELIVTRSKYILLRISTTWTHLQCTPWWSSVELTSRLWRRRGGNFLVILEGHKNSRLGVNHGRPLLPPLQVFDGEGQGACPSCCPQTAPPPSHLLSTALSPRVHVVGRCQVLTHQYHLWHQRPWPSLARDWQPS